MNRILPLVYFVATLAPVLGAGVGIPPTPKPTSKSTAKATPGPTPPKLRDGVFFRNENPKLGTMLNQKFDEGGFRVRLKLASRLLDTWTQRLEEYGSVTMSAPLFAPPSDTFKFDLKRSDNEYFEAAKKDVQGKAAADLAIIQQFSAGVAVQLDPTAAAGFDARVAQFQPQQQLFQQRVGNDNLAAAALRKAADVRLQGQLQTAAQQPTPEARTEAAAAAYDTYNKALSSTTPPSPPTFPTLADGEANTPKPHARVAPETKLSDSEQKFLDLVSGPTNIDQNNVVSDRTALVEAAGNRAVQSIFTLLGDPEGVQKFKDKKVLFATVMVGVNPGWRTRKDFSAEITTQITYRLQKARGEVVQALEKEGRLKDLVNLDDILESHKIKPTATPTPAPAAQSAALREAVANTIRRQAELDAAAAAAQEQAEVAETARLAAQRADNLARQAAETLLRATQSPPVARPQPPSQGGAQVAPPPPQPAATFDTALEETFSTQSATARATLERIAKQTLDRVAGPARQNAPPTEESAAQLLEQSHAVEELFQRSAVSPPPAAPGAPPPPPPSPYNSNFWQARDLINTTLYAGQLGQVSARQERLSQSTQNTKANAASTFTAAKALESRVRGDGSGGPGRGPSASGPIRDHRDRFFDDRRFFNGAPVVAGVSPLMETQVLDLKDSFRRQDQIGLALSATLRAAGKGGQADAFERFVKQQRKDAATRSSVPVVNTFSASGGLFGFQVGPRLQALEDPARRKGGSANVLDRQSFPALLIIGLEAADIAPVVAMDYNGEPAIFEPVLEMRQTSRWNPLDRKLISLSKNDWWNPSSWHNPRYSERDRLNDALQVVDQFQDLDRWLQRENQWVEERSADADQTARMKAARADGKEYRQDPDEGINEYEAHTYRDIVSTLQQRRDALRTLMDGSLSSQRIPVAYVAPTKPKDPPADFRITRVLPSQLTLTAQSGTLSPTVQTQQLVLYLEGVAEGAHLVASVLGTAGATITTGTLNDDGTIEAQLTMTQKASAIAIQIEATAEGNTLQAISAPIPVKVVDSNIAGLVPALRAVVQKGAANDGSETVLFEINPEHKDAAAGLENILVERAREALQLDIKKVKAVPK